MLTKITSAISGINFKHGGRFKVSPRGHLYLTSNPTVQATLLNGEFAVYGGGLRKGEAWKKQVQIDNLKRMLVEKENLIRIIGSLVKISDPVLLEEEISKGIQKLFKGCRVTPLIFFDEEFAKEENIKTIEEVLKLPIVKQVQETAKVIISEDKKMMGIPLKIDDKMLGLMVITKVNGENFNGNGDVSIAANYADHAAWNLYRVQELKEKEKALDKARIDGLTQLIWDKKYIEEILSREIERAKRYKRKVTILCMDIDLFKSINDNYGHLAGDTLLKRVAKILKEEVRGTDFAIPTRYGGEEFLIILPEADKKGALTVAERIRKGIEAEEFVIEDPQGLEHKIKKTVSIGIAAYPEDGEEIKSLLQNVDQCLYKAKAEGRNRVVAVRENGSIEM